MAERQLTGIHRLLVKQETVGFPQCKQDCQD